MNYTVIGELPLHQYAFVDTRFTHREPVGFVPVVWYGLVSMPGRTWGCTVMFQSGAIYRNVPVHAMAFTTVLEDAEWTPQDAQTWDCYGPNFTVLRYGYLSGLDVLVRANKQEMYGSYLFTVAPLDDGFSQYPEQAKEFSFVRLDNGRLTVQPTNHLVFRERSWTGDNMAFPTDLKRQTEVYSCE